VFIGDSRAWAHVWPSPPSRDDTGAEVSMIEAGCRADRDGMRATARTVAWCDTDRLPSEDTLAGHRAVCDARLSAGLRT